MNDINSKCLEVFPKWLKSLGDDVGILHAASKTEQLGLDARKKLTGGINYLFKSLDLVPDGIDDIGYLDDAFILRMAAKGAVEAGLDALDEELKSKVAELGEDSSLIMEFLGSELYQRLAAYTESLADGSARGRSVDEIIEDSDTASSFGQEVNDFINGYEAPGFSPDEKNLIKLKAFMDAKLPK